MWPEGALPLVKEKGTSSHCWKPGYCEAEAGNGPTWRHLRVRQLGWGKGWRSCGCCWVLREGPAEGLWGERTGPERPAGGGLGSWEQGEAHS